MMGVQPSEIAALSLYEYGGLLHHWNVLHGDGKTAPEPIDIAEMERDWAEIVESGLGVMVH